MAFVGINIYLTIFALNIPDIFVNSHNTDFAKLQKQKEYAHFLHLQSREQAWTRCSTEPQVPAQVGDFGQFPGPDLLLSGVSRGRRAIDTELNHKPFENSVLLLSGNTGSLLREESSLEDAVPRQAFTMQIWCKPEGGQSNPSIILETDDFCTPFVNKGWKLGIQNLDKSGERDARFFFSLQTFHSRQATTLFAPKTFIPGEWYNLAVSYDEKRLLFFINGAQVASSFEQRGETFMKTTSNSCRQLYIGGSNGQYFRGTVDHLQIWNHSLSHKVLLESMITQPLRPGLKTHSIPVFEDEFNTIDNWEWSNSNKIDFLEDFPTLLHTGTLYKPYRLVVRPPPCGFTVCDMPDIVNSYLQNWELRHPKVIRYRIVNVKNNDGSNPTVSDDQIRKQHKALEMAFSPYNISWNLVQVSIHNSSLRQREILFGCDSDKIGNGECNPECQFPVTGNDGGDCDREISECDRNLLGNGICDFACNKAYHGWDSNDCCSSDYTNTWETCFDSKSLERAYLDVSEYKAILKFDNSNHINVMFAQWTNKDIIGVSTFPWEKDVFSEQGGIVVRPNDFGMEGHMGTLVHEMGHALGLWHVHRGVSEVDCRDPCFENESSMTVGDLCRDTEPTPLNEHCKDPEEDMAICGVSKFKNTPYKNYMGYTDDSCTDHFSGEQVARMHCYLDLRYSRIQKSISEELPPPPLPPTIIASEKDSVTFTWLPPLSITGFHEENDCSQCTEERELIQYAKDASSVFPSSYVSYWQQSQATGPPDSETCYPSYKAWLPDSINCSDESCTLVLSFTHQVVPTFISLWITWNAHYGLDELKFIFSDGSAEFISNLRGNCDMPLTIPLFFQKTLDKIILKCNNSFVSVDSVKIISTPNHPVCAPCKPLKYRVFRQPPFKTSQSKEAEGNEFTDREITLHEHYSYRIQAWLGSQTSAQSPTLSFYHGLPFCGDGKINSSEECDDANVLQGDGCNSQCMVELNFHCRGEPSLCYWHQDDGICEPFEEQSSILDCGFYTPSGFHDQWAVSVNTGPEPDNDMCPANVVAGPPHAKVSCGLETDPLIGWHPCQDFSSDNWLAVWFPDPVVATSIFIYLSSDGAVPFMLHHKTAEVRLIDVSGKDHFIKEITLSCVHNPIVVNIIHDLSTSFYLTAGVNITFSSLDVAFAAVSLRSSEHLNPVVISQCEKKDLYNPRLQKCVSYSCKLPVCSKPLAKHAKVQCSGYEESDSCEILCDEGHWRVDKNMITCNEGKWVGADLHCKPIDCGPPMIPHADAICPDGMTYGKICNFKCRPPARLKGSFFSLGSITCEKNGHWSSSEAHCQVTCAIPAAPNHAVMDSHQCRQAENLYYGHLCRFRCKIGYHVEEFSVRKQTLYLKCDSTGSWSGPVCVPIICPPPPLILKGLYSCTEGFVAGSVCTLNCSTDKEVFSSRCNLDGTWSQPIQSCTSFSGLRCPLPIIHDLNVKIHCESYNIGSTCKVSCAQFKGELTSKDVSDKDILLNKQKIICTGERKWYPHPENLICQHHCQHAYMGDGFCDGSNNREKCDWDGGDCCSSTVKDHVVKPFPSNCIEECKCLDPKTPENTGYQSIETAREQNRFLHDSSKDYRKIK